MAKGKGVHQTWFCPECKCGNHHSQYVKRADVERKKEQSKFCSHCRKHTVHKAKDTKS